MRVIPVLCTVVLAASACVGSVIEYSDEASNDDPSGDGDPSDESESETEAGDGDGDGDGDPTGDGDGDDDAPGDGDPTGDGDSTDDCPGGCMPGYECVEGRCLLSDYPWGNCGWNADKEWYECGYEGESPDPQFPIDCSKWTLVSGAACPQGFTVEGCCAVGGDSWWCEGGFVKRAPCGV